MFLNDVEYFNFQNFIFKNWLRLSIVDHPLWADYWAYAQQERLDNLNR